MMVPGAALTVERSVDDKDLLLPFDLSFFASFFRFSSSLAMTKARLSDHDEGGRISDRGHCSA